MFKFNKEAILNKVKEGFDKDAILNKVKDGIEHIKSDISKKSPDEYADQIFSEMSTDGVFLISKEDGYWLATSEEMHFSIERINTNVLTFTTWVEIDHYENIINNYENNNTVFNFKLYGCNRVNSITSVLFSDDKIWFRSHVRLDTPPPYIYTFLNEFRDEVKNSLEFLSE